jgi:hypothetical protein
VLTLFTEASNLASGFFQFSAPTEVVKKAIAIKATKVLYTTYSN